MARSRLELQALLEQFTVHVYFQPPNNSHILYPCIVYERDVAETAFADNSPYRYTKKYLVTVIDPNPDSEIPDKVAELPLCTHNRFFTTSKLNHDVFNLFF